MLLSRRSLLTVAAGLLVFGPMSAFSQDQSGDPNQWILSISNQVLDLIRGDAKLAAGDSGRVHVFVNDIVMPTVDFLRMTRMCIGPKWRTATPEQRTKLQGLFREQLIRVYSGALSAVKNQKAELAPSRLKPTDKDALVRTVLVEAGKPDIHLDYRLKKVKGLWYIVDVNVEGIWLVDNYRNQFAGIVNSSGVEGLIAELEKKNAGA